MCKGRIGVVSKTDACETYAQASEPPRAAKLAKEAIALEPRDPRAHDVLSTAYIMANDPRAVQARLDMLGLLEPDTKGWALAALFAWDLSISHFKHIRPCGKVFCAKRCCAKLPAWMRDAAECKQMADRCVTVVPDDADAADARKMQARALIGLGEFEAAGGAWIQAARRSSDDAAQKEAYLRRARIVFAKARARNSSD